MLMSRHTLCNSYANNDMVCTMTSGAKKEKEKDAEFFRSASLKRVETNE